MAVGSIIIYKSKLKRHTCIGEQNLHARKKETKRNFHGSKNHRAQRQTLLSAKMSIPIKITNIINPNFFHQFYYICVNYEALYRIVHFVLARNAICHVPFNQLYKREGE